MTSRTTADDNISFSEPVTISVDGERIAARRGQTIAAALLGSGRRIFRRTRNAGKPRGLYCGMGVCYDCLVKVDERTERACMVKVEEGMQVTLTRQFAAPKASA